MSEINTHTCLPLNFGVVLCSITAAKAGDTKCGMRASNFLLSKRE